MIKSSLTLKFKLKIIFKVFKSTKKNKIKVLEIKILLMINSV